MNRTPRSAAGNGSRPVLAGVAANLAAGTLFGWSLVSSDAAAGVGMSHGAAAAVFATAIVVFAGVLPAVGPAQRRWGGRRLLYLAAGVGAGGLLLAAAARGPLALWAGIGLLFGAANGVGYGVAVGLAARTPEQRRGTATGLVVAAYAAGPVLLGLVAPAALRSVGWRPCLAGLAVVVAALLVLAARLAAPDGTGPGDRGSRGERPPRRAVILLWLVFAGGTAPGLALFAHAVPLAADRQLSPQAAGLAVSALAAGNLAGRLLAGWWSDRIGRLPALAVALATAAVAVGGLAVPASPVVLAGFLAAGTAYGAVSSLVPAATADRVGADAFPAAYGRVFTGWGCAGLLAPLAGSALLRLQDQQPALLGLAAAPLIPAAVAVLLLRQRAPREAGA
ncbi:MAG TPA: MFS transporter [Geodermatophilus sp.]|nr:MFS transporter [Geodermatophilus sp.]